jgi:hypothetical protein
MKRVTFFAAAFVVTCLAVIPVFAAEATFDRTLKVSGKVDLTVSTGAGNIRINHGADGQIHVTGRVRSGFGGSDEQVRQIADNPPIEQTGNIVRIGVRASAFGARTCTTSASIMKSRRPLIAS